MQPSTYYPSLHFLIFFMSQSHHFQHEFATFMWTISHNNFLWLENCFNIQGLSCPFRAGMAPSNAPSHHIVFNCFRQYQRNKSSVEDALRSACPATSLTKQTIECSTKNNWRWSSFNISTNRGHIKHQFHRNQFNNSSLFKAKKSLWWISAAYTNWWPKTTPTSILPSFTKEIWRRSVSSCIWHNNWWWILFLPLWSSTKRTMKSLLVDNWSSVQAKFIKTKVPGKEWWQCFSWNLV